MITTEREEKESISAYLYRLQNYDLEDFFFSTNYLDKETGEQRFGKRINLLELQSRPLKEQAFYAQQATHRKILPCEVLIDIDNAKLRLFDWLDEVSYEFPDIKSKAKWVAQQLHAKGIPFSSYWTQNKSYHISFILPSLANKSPNKRTEIKKRLIEEYGGDTMLGNPHSQVAIESQLHYRSGKPKIKVDLLH